MVTGVRLVDKLQHKRTPHVRIEVAIHFGDQDAASVGCRIGAIVVDWENETFLFWLKPTYIFCAYISIYVYIYDSK